MAKVYLLIIIVFISGTVTAQLKLNIIVSQNDKTGFTAELFQLPDSSSVNKITGTDSCSFSVQPHTNYFIIISAAGMRETIKDVIVSDSSLSLQINLKPKSGELKNVTIISRKPLVKQEDDKTIVDAEVLAQSSTNAYEVLEKVPGAVVDQDGNVYLNSATPATIQINGRDVKLSTADLTSLLKSLPANSVLKIEVLRSPSAKYDASSSGGILNIVLKKGVKIGTNGSANAGYTQGKYHTATTGFNLNRNISKTSTYFSYQFTNRKNFETLNTDRFTSSDTSVISQKAYTTYPSINNYFSAGIDVTLTDKLTLGYDTRVILNNNKSHAENNVSIFNTYTGITETENRSLIDNKSSSFYMGNNFSAKYKIDTIGSEWSASADINFFRNNNGQLYMTNYDFPSKPSMDGDGTTHNRKNIFSAQTDLVLKLKSNYTLETGAKLNISASSNNSEYFIDSSINGRQIDISQTNRFKYKEVISSVYLQMSKTFFGFTVKPGLRMESTNMQGTQVFPADTSITIRRTDFFPYLYLRHNLFKIMGFTLTGNIILRRSISRPYYEILNPYPKYIDLYLRDVGNPGLRPQFTTNYEFNVMADDIPVLSIGVNDTKDIFTNVTYPDPDTSSKIAYRTYDNLGRNKETYFRVLGGIPPGMKYFFYVGAQYNLVHYTGAYNLRPFEYKRGSWLFFMYQNYRPFPDINISLHGFMRLKGLQNFYEIKTIGGLSMSVNKTIMNKKANLILSANDIFRTNKFDFNIDQAGIKAEGIRFNDTRRIGLTFRYNFGFKPKEENSTRFGQVPEATN